jgi:hypothetical protein
MRNNIVALAFSSLLVSSFVSADSPAPQERYQKVVGAYVFVMLPVWGVGTTSPDASEPRYGASGLYRNDGSTTPVWTIDWYAYEDQVHVTADGRFLVRVETWPSTEGDVAVAFYDRGRLLDEHRISDLVREPEKLPHSVSHFTWLKSAELDDETRTFRLATLEGEIYAFDIAASARPDGGEAALIAEQGLRRLTLASGDSVEIPEADLSIEVWHVGYSHCPEGAECAAPDGPFASVRVSQLSRGTELFAGQMRPALSSPSSNIGPVLQPVGVEPTVVFVEDSDGHSYVRLGVHDAAAWCRHYGGRRDEAACWTRLAEATGREDFCQRIVGLGLPLTGRCARVPLR